MTPTDKGDGSSDKTCVFDSGQQGFLTRGNRVAHDVLYQLPLHGEAGVAHFATRWVLLATRTTAEVMRGMAVSGSLWHTWPQVTGHRPIRDRGLYRDACCDRGR